MKDSITNPPEKDPNSIMTVADQGQGGLEEKTRSNSTTQSSIALTKDNPAITTSQRRSKRYPSKTAEDGAMKGRSLFPSDVAQGQDGSMAKARSNSTTPSSTDFTEDNPDTMLSKSQRKQTPPSKTAEDGAVQGRPLVAYTKKLRVSKFHRLYKKAWRQEVFGNQAFITWSSRTAEHFGHAISKCPGWWAEASTDQADAHSYDEIAALILSGLKVYDPSLGGSMPQLRSSMQNLFSLGDLEDADNDKASWSLREYFLRLATQCPTVVFDLAAAQRVIKTDEKLPRFWEFALVFDPTLIVQRAEPLTWMWLAASEFFAHPWTGPAILPPIVEEFERLERESKISKAQSKSKKRPASTPENPKVILSDAVHVIASTPTGTQEASAPTDAVVEASKPCVRTSEEHGAEDHNSAPTYRDAAASPPASTVPLTTDERLTRLLAVTWNASPFRHITIFNVSIVFDWQGVGLSEFNQVQTAYNAFHQFASGIWGEITSTVVLLPFADGRFTRQQLWIRNLKEFDEKAKDWAHLKIYLDPNFGNPYILNKPGKTGSKTYKTRMRFGMDTAPPILMQELRSVLSSEPRAGVFPTPIQVSITPEIGRRRRTNWSLANSAHSSTP
ncbi:unnamed protein product [Cylindrotheca closterium]|uniref:Uncharacterized protein n=1 Tax=Cylindrotheca closterium TaxID=2856 RepID=A0AAD2CHX8_9STRA|nr:unnamed protein product [Cylindrotheca closterium]